MSVQGWPDRGIVGREELVDELVAVAHDAVAGSGSLVLLTGEAGIGKTSVARTVARRVRGDLPAAWGTCVADGSAPPLWPWRGVVDIAAAPSDSADAPDAAIGVQRFEHLAGLRDQFLGRRPCLFVIEDLQWADVSSVLLLAHVGVALVDAPIMVVGTVRTGEPLAQRLEAAIEDVRRLAAVRTVAPLTSDEVESLVRESGLEPAGEVSARVHARTGGNPLFVNELLRSVRGADAGRSALDVLSASVPDRISELIDHRLVRLPPAVTDVVAAAAVIGGEGDVRTLAAVTGDSAESVVELLEQAQSARLLDLARPGRWQFGHELVRDAVYSQLTETARAQAHAAVLETLAEDVTTPPPVLAHHALAAQPLVDPERAVALAARAGQDAFEQHAHEEAVRWFEHALGVTTSDVAPRWRAELLVLLGESLRQTGEIDDARRAFSEASSLVSDADLLARAALGYADPGADLGIAYRSEDPATVALLERAITAQADPQSATRVLLEARLAAELYFSDQPDQARSLAEGALARAQAVGDLRALGAASAVVHDAFVVGQADLADQLSGSEQLLAWARSSGSAASLLTAHRARVFDLLAAGDLLSMDGEILAFRRVAEPLRSPAYQWWLSLWSAMRALLEGHHELAEEEAAGAYERGARPFPALALVNLSFLLFFLRREQGRFAEMEQPTREYARSHADVPALRVALAFVLAETGRDDEASGLLAAIADRDLARLHDRNWPASWFQLARAAALLGNRSLAATLLEPGNRPTERCVMVSLATACLGSTDLATAWLLHTVGELDGAADHYAAAEAVNARIGARSWLAQTRADHASLLLDRASPGDADEASRLLGLAADAAADIGMPALVGFVEEQSGRLRSPPSTAAADAAAGVAAVGDGAVGGSAAAVFRRAGSVWEVDFAGRRAQLAHSRGLIDVAFLLSRPEESVSVLELVGDGPAAAETRGAPVLDDRARREIRQRLADLDEEVAEAEADNDGERAALAREQRQLLAEAVARDLGLGGRARRFDDPVERARKTVSTRIRRAIASIGREHPELGRHLERSIDTGSWCAYRPAEPTNWVT